MWTRTQRPRRPRSAGSAARTPRARRGSRGARATRRGRSGRPARSRDAARDRRLDVEAVGIRELALVAVRRRREEQDARSPFGTAAPYHSTSRVRSRGPVLRRRRVAQHLLDARRGCAPASARIFRVLRRDGARRARPRSARSFVTVSLPAAPSQRAEADDLAVGEPRRAAVVVSTSASRSAQIEPVVRPPAELRDEAGTSSASSASSPSIARGGDVAACRGRARARRPSTREAARDRPPGRRAA